MQLRAPDGGHRKGQGGTMDEIPAFWSGAMEQLGTLDLRVLAERVGGLRALQEGESALVAAGVPRARASAWSRASPRRTRGIALPFDDPRYPVRLRDIPCPPPVVLVEGEISAISDRAVAIVGTRRCTAYGKAIARKLAHELASRGIVVVSGLARGIDGQAHLSALAVGKTVAVLGHGLAHTAPVCHDRLRAQILDHGGALLSTWHDAVEPRPHTFPVRNAWISGLSEAVVVVEAPARSGALRTAGAAADQGREVFAVPGPVGAEESRGCLDLIAAGAQVLVDVEEFVRRWGGAPLATEFWLQRLFLGATIDEVAADTGRSVRQIRVDLVRLEMEGKVVKLPGERYSPGRGWR